MNTKIKEIINRRKKTFYDMIDNVEYSNGVLTLFLSDYSYQHELSYLFKLDFLEIDEKVTIIIK